MLDDATNSLPEDSVVDFNSVLDRLRSFDKYLGQSSQDLDDILIADHHDKSFLDLNESCFISANKFSTISRPVVKHDGILEKILETSHTPPTRSHTKSTIRKPTPSSSLVRNASRLKTKSEFLPTISSSTNDWTCADEDEQSQPNGTTLLKLVQDDEQQHDNANRRRHRSRISSKESQCSTKPIKKVNSTNNINRQPVDESSEECRMKGEDESLKRPNGPVPSASKSHEHSDNSTNCEHVSVNLHNSETTLTKSRSKASKRNTRQDLYRSTTRRQDSSRQVTKNAKPSLLSTQSDHVLTAGERRRALLETRRASSRTMTQDGESISPLAVGRKKPTNASTSPRAQMKKSFSDRQLQDSQHSEAIASIQDEASQCRRSPRRGRKQLHRHASSPKRSSSCGRRTRVTASGHHSRERDPNTGGRSTQGKDRIRSSSRDGRPSSLRRIGSLTHTETGKRKEKDSLKRMESVHSFFGNNGGPGIVTTPVMPIKRVVSAVEVRSQVSASANQEPPSNETVNHLLLDLRRNTGRNMMQKFKPSRNLQAGIMDDVL